MPQNGLHGLVGLAVARVYAPKAPPEATTATAIGALLGAMLPDADVYPAAAGVLLGIPDSIDLCHRTATHSLLAVLLAASAAVIFRRSPVVSWGWRGATLGLATHVLLDLFFWFAPIDLFWPLSRLPSDRPLMPIVNLWHGIMPDLSDRRLDRVFNLRDSMEFAASGLYLGVLGSITGRPPAIKILALAAWLLLPIAVTTAFVLPFSRQIYLVMVPMLGIFLPASWLFSYRLRDAIARWARGDVAQIRRSEDAPA